MTLEYTARAPGPPLDRYVEIFWHYSGLQPDHSLEKILPDGAVELIIDLTDFPKRLHDPDDLRLARLYRDAWISGMRTEHLVIGADPGSSMMGVRFRPGGVGAFLPCPAAEIADRVIELDRIWGRASSSLRERLLEAPDARARFGIVEAFLHERYRDRFAPRPLVLEALERLRQTPGPLRVVDVAAELGVSQKHLIELFDRSVGLKPKAAHRVFRFVNALERIHGHRGLNWSALALDCGYYDQSHFNREFRAFSGITPTEYEEHGGDLLFYVVLDRREHPPTGSSTVKNLQDDVDKAM